MFICENDRYCPTAETFGSIAAFQMMCVACFGAPINVHRRNGGAYYVDDSGEIVLRRIA
jgi:hypothetical protein